MTSYGTNDNILLAVRDSLFPKHSRKKDIWGTRVRDSKKTCGEHMPGHIIKTLWITGENKSLELNHSLIQKWIFLVENFMHVKCFCTFLIFSIAIECMHALFSCNEIDTSNKNSKTSSFILVWSLLLFLILCKIFLRNISFTLLLWKKEILNDIYGAY